MLLAQNLGEYGAVTGAISEGLTTARIAVEDQIRRTEPLTWLGIVTAMVLVWLVFFRSR